MQISRRRVVACPGLSSSLFFSLSLFVFPPFFSLFFFLRTKTRSTETGNSNNERRNRIVLRDSRRMCVCVCVFACLSGSGDISWGMVLRWKWRRCVRCCSVLVSFGNFFISSKRKSFSYGQFGDDLCLLLIREFSTLF